MSKLNQIIAVVNGKKTKVHGELTELHKLSQKDQLFNGLTRNYKPFDEDGEQLPGESKNVIHTVDGVLEECENILSPFWDTVSTQDYTNCLAKADIVVNGNIVVSSVPVTNLLFLEKQLHDLRTFVSKLPTLDQAEVWNKDDNRNCFVTEPFYSNRNKKVYRNHVKAQSTKEHPEQVEVYTEDVSVGKWETTKLSGSMPVKDKKDLLDKITLLQEGVKSAREQANMIEVKDFKVGKKIFSFLME